jgi:hypothetical protein
MAVRPESLDNRAVTGAPSAAPPAAAEQLVALRQRIRRGLNEVGDDPRPKDAPACKECFQRGWIAALRSLQE